MPLPRAFLTVVLAAAASLFLGLQLHAAADSPEVPNVMGVSWDDRPNSLNQLDDLATVGVEAEVIEINDGPDIAVDPDDPTGLERIPTQRIKFRTIDVLQGQIGETFELFKTGSADTYLKDDPPYVVGQRYVLLLRPREDDPGVYLPAAPDGRLIETSSGHVDGTIPGPVDQEVQGDTPAQIDQQLDP